MRPVILTFVRHYLPGFRSGPTRSIANLVHTLSDRFDFRIVALDRDAGDTSAYSVVKADGSWHDIEGARVFYLGSRRTGLRHVAEIVRDTAHDALYLNSFFDPQFTLKPLIARRLGLASKTPGILAPRGEFSPGALQIKATKKRVFLGIAGPSRLYADLTWQATTDIEKRDIRHTFGKVARDIAVAPNVTALAPEVSFAERQAGDALRVCFFSRISPKKQLPFALEVLQKVRSPISFDIYGPIDDQAEWRRAEAAMARLPTHVRASYKGSIAHEQVATILSGYDMFFLPTRGENFGHAIFESLAAGTPVLIADTTPWQGLTDVGVGWDVPLDRPEAFIEAIDKFAEMGVEQQIAMRRRVRVFARQRHSEDGLIEATANLFYGAITRRQYSDKD